MPGIGIPSLLPASTWGRPYGTTADRPTNARTGQQYFDTDLVCIIVWNGTAWQFSSRPGWVDLVGDVNQAAAIAALTHEEYRDTPELWYWLHRSQDDQLSIKWQMRHDWIPSDVYPHLHLVGAAPTTGNVRVVGRYAWSHTGDLPLPVLAGWGTIDVTVPILDTEQWAPKIASLGPITPPVLAQKPSAFLHLWIQRPGASDALDTYDGNKPDHTAAANVGLEGLDCHVYVSGVATAGLYA